MMRTTAVYFHRDVDTNEIVYIGIATNVPGQRLLKRKYPRAFDRTSKLRKPHHVEYCAEHEVSVEIAYEFKSKREALDKEMELIKTIRPRLNVMGLD